MQNMLNMLLCITIKKYVSFVTYGEETYVAGCVYIMKTLFENV